MTRDFRVHGHAMLQQEGADLITGTLTDPSFTHAVERLEVNLLGDLRRDELHGRALHRLGDRLGIALTLYLVGFMVIGAEWFAMWQSQRWDGRQRAFSNPRVHRHHHSDCPARR